MFLSVNNLGFFYSPDSPIFEGFNWEVGQAERWAVLGPSGCGKSSLLLLVAGILKPTSGSITIKGKNLQRPRPRTGLILQDYGLMPWATVEENAALGLKLHQFYGPDGTHVPADAVIESYQANLDHWLEKLGLDPYRTRYPAQISGGQQQRTAIARTLTLNPDLLLMDEPLGSLDAPTSTALQELLIELNQEDNLAQILVTHSVETAAFLGEKILILSLPPTNELEVIDNPQSGRKDYRGSGEYARLCQTLRTKLEVSL
jgi:NitT/TauT family transport system ATP-binding protein